MQLTPNDWDRAKELFEAALELEPTERASFLAENCHEVSLQQQVEKLLIDYQAAGSFLDKPALHSLDETVELEDPMVNRRLGAYKLVKRLGQGGMAAVFLALRADDEYQKEVAVKLVQPGLDSQDVLSRFRKERQTLAGLDHPNIVRLLDGGSTPEGWPFLVMEYVEGRPIDNYCDQHKLSVDDRLRLFGRVCESVQYAHEKLVIHRDLKPSNILVLPDGTPKLLDFGIAKVLNPEHSNQNWLATQTGLRCMTPAYASPEQARGKSVTPMTDVYSLGVVLYELLTGHRPYRLTQHSPADIERAICEQEPETPSTAISRVENDMSPDGKPITKTPELVSLTREGQPDKLRRRLRGDLDNIVLKALQKEPQQRYNSVAEFSQDIDRHLHQQPIKARPNTLPYYVSKFAQRHKIGVSAAFAVLIALALATSFAFNAGGIRNHLGTGSSQTRIQSLAVIPLANISGDPSQEYFSDGITDALIADLAEIGSLKVISRTSSMQYKQTKKTLPEIAHELKVDGIVEGTVRRSGDRMRITTNLIQAATDKHVWTRSYERDVRDLFTLEREVAEDIARQVHAEGRTEKQAQLSRPQPADPKALDAYLRGNYYLTRAQWNVSEDEKQMAADYFQQAIDADPNFASAYIGLANAHTWLARNSSEDTAISKRAAERALELAPNSSDAWDILGFIKWRGFDWAGAEQDFRRAVALNPNHVSSIDNLGLLLGATGRLDDALREAGTAQELDPNEDHLSIVLEMRREHKRAIELLQRMVALHPTDNGNHIFLGRNYGEIGMLEEATQELEKGLTLMGAADVAAGVHRGFAASGYQGAMREYAKALENFQAANKVFVPENLAYAYLASGDKDRAFYWLEQAYEHRELVGQDWGLMIIKEDRLFDPIRSDPRFKDLLRRVGLPDAPINDSEADNTRNTVSDRPGIGSSQTKIRSLAVIPLANISSDPAQEYFSDGITDDLITDLAEIGSLKVISRTSSMQYKHSKKTLPQIAHELNVDGIIEGTVQRSGDRLRITANLIQAATDKHLWTRSYERDVRDSFMLEREVAGDIARQVHAELKLDKQAQLAQPRTIKPAALEAYLQGNSHMHRFSRGFGDEELALASDCFQQAISAEPGFAPAYVGLAKVRRATLRSSREDEEVARKAVEHAIELDSTLSDAWTALADIKCDFWDWEGAEQDFRRALALNPNDAAAHEHFGSLLDALGRLDEGWKEAEIAQQLDPSQEHLEPALDHRREYDAIIQHITMMLQSDPDSAYLHHKLYEGYSGKGMYKDAIQELEETLVLLGFQQLAAKLRQTFATSGYKGAIRVYAQELERLQDTGQGNALINLAGAYAAAGDNERAFYWLQQLDNYRGRSTAGIHVVFINRDPGLDPLRSDPRYKDLLRRVGLPP